MFAQSIRMIGKLIKKRIRGTNAGKNFSPASTLEKCQIFDSNILATLSISKETWNQLGTNPRKFPFRFLNRTTNNRRAEPRKSHQTSIVRVRTWRQSREKEVGWYEKAYPSPQKARSPRKVEGGEHGGKHYNKSAAVWRECKIAGTDLVVYNTRGEGRVGRKGCKLEWRGGGARLKAMAHCECYLSCCLRIYGVRYRTGYPFVPIGRLSMVIAIGYSQAPYVKEGENLSSSSPSRLSFLVRRFAGTRWTGEGRGKTLLLLLPVGYRCYYL